MCWHILNIKEHHEWWKCLCSQTDVAQFMEGNKMSIEGKCEWAADSWDTSQKEFRYWQFACYTENSDWIILTISPIPHVCYEIYSIFGGLYLSTVTICILTLS